MSHSSLHDITAVAERDDEVVTSLHSASSSSLQRSASVPTRHRDSAFRNSNRSRICVRPRPQQQQRSNSSSQRHQSAGIPSNTEQSREADKTGDVTLSTASLTANDNKTPAPPTSPTHHAAGSFMRQLSDMYALSTLIDEHSVDGSRFSVELIEKLPYELLEAIKDGTLSADTYALILRRQKELRQGHLPLLEPSELSNNDLMWWHGQCVCVCVCVCVYVRACVYLCVYVCMYVHMYVSLCVHVCEFPHFT